MEWGRWWWCWRWWYLLHVLVSPLLVGVAQRAEGASEGAARTYGRCADAFADNNAQSREVTLEVLGGDKNKIKVNVFCMFNGDGTGFVFVAREAILNSDVQPIDLDQISKDRSKVVLRILYGDGRQEDTVIRELAQYRDHQKLTLLVNNYEGFAKVKNTGSMGEQYVYLGILDVRTAAVLDARQGFSSNNKEIDFINCDGSPDSYFALFPQKNIPDSGSQGSALVRRWLETATPVPKNKQLPVDNYAYMLEVNFGGCGAFEISSEWRDRVRGVAFAMPFTYDSCGDPGRVEGASREMRTGVIFDGDVAYSCLEGYRHASGNLNRKCSAEQGWTGTAPVCERVRCPVAAQSPLGVEWQVSPPGGYYDSILTSWCISGYQSLEGDEDRKCLQEGVWSGRPLNCTRVSCGLPELVAFSNKTGMTYLFGDVIQYTCDVGYVSVGGNLTRQCTRHGNWSGDVPRCTRISCGPPPSTPHGSPRGSSHLYGDVIRHECDPGYTTSDDVKLVCLANATWEGRPPTCQRIACIPPPLVEYAEWSGETKYGDHVVYKCNKGYQGASGDVKMTCNKYGYWSGRPPVCKRISCGDPGPVVNAHHSGTYLYDDRVLYVCDDGYVFMGGDAILVCQADGRWRGDRIICQEDQNPSNVPVYCPPAPYVADATGEAPDTYLIPVNTLVSYNCYEHHEFPDEKTSRSIVCLSSGRWNKDPGHCHLKRCPPLPEIRHGHVVRAVPVIFSWHVAYCDVGHAFPDGTRRRSVICLSNKKWSSPIEDCQPIDCPQPPPANVVVLPPEVNETRPEVDKYACLNDMRSEIGTEVQLTSCGSKGLWTRPVSNCSAESCFAPPLVENATLVQYGIRAGATAHFLCRRGSRFPSGLETHEITCLGRDWDETVVQPCSVTNCPVPRDLPDATLYATNYFYSGTIIRYECDYGFWFAPGVHQRELECMASGLWDQDVGSCQRILCPDLEVLTGAVLDTTNRTVDSLVALRCPPGQRFPYGESSSVVTCQLTGNWTNLPGHCRDKRCPPVPHVTHAKFSTVVADRGTRITVTCLPGYELLSNGEESFELLCGRQDEWQGPIENCSAVFCGDAPSPPLTSTNQSGAYFGDSAVISCIPGYRFWEDVSDLHLDCQADSTWSLNLTGLSCQPLECPFIPYVGNATPSEVELVYNSTITYTCLHGYWSRDHKASVSVRCAESGYWEPDVQGCLEIECPPVPVWLPILPNSTRRRFGVTINYTCAENSSFETSEPWRLANCTLEGEWSPIILPCEAIPDNTTIPPKEAEGSDTIGTFACGLCVLVFGMVVLLDILTIQKDILILRRNLAACLPCMAPQEDTPTHQEDYEMMPLMRTRSRMYTCENGVSDCQMKSFDHPDVKLFHGESDSDIGLLSISSGDFNSAHYHSESLGSANSFDPFLSTTSPVILKPQRLVKSGDVSYREADSAETFLSSISTPDPQIPCPLADDENWDDDEILIPIDVDDVAIDTLAPQDAAIDSAISQDTAIGDVISQDVAFDAVSSQEVAIDNIASYNVAFGDMSSQDVAFGDMTSQDGDIHPRTKLFCDAVQQLCDPSKAQHGADSQSGQSDELDDEEESPLVKGLLQNGTAGALSASSSSPI